MLFGHVHRSLAAASRATWRPGALGALGRPIPPCSVRVVVGLGKGAPLRGSPLRRTLEPEQARAAVTAAASRYFESFTLTQARGLWRGQGEPALVVEVLRAHPVYDPSCEALARRARCLASDLRALFRQQAVLVVVTDEHGRVNADLVGAVRRRGCRAAAPRDATRAARRAA